MIPSQLAQLLEFNILNGFPTMITGQPGIGKTDIVKSSVKAVEKKTGTKYELLISHPVVSDPTDYKGMPFVANGEADFLPFGDLKKLTTTEHPLVYFLDDLGQASMAVQAAAMQLLLERRINGHAVKDNVVFVAASNRHSDRAGVSGILEPVKSRFATIVNLETNVDDWCAWAYGNGMPHELVSFIRFKDKHLTDFKPTKELTNSACPRTIANVGKYIVKKLPKELEHDVYTGAAGEAFAVEFIAYLKVARSLQDPNEILANPKTATVPTELDQRYAMCGALVSAVSDKTFANMIEYLERMNNIEFQVMAFRDAIHQKPELARSPAFTAFTRKHHQVLIG